MIRTRMIFIALLLSSAGACVGISAGYAAIPQGRPSQGCQPILYYGQTLPPCIRQPQTAPAPGPYKNNPQPAPNPQAPHYAAWNEGKAAFNRKDYKTALALFREAEQGLSNLELPFWVNVTQAYIAWTGGNYEAALNDFSWASENALGCGTCRWPDANWAAELEQKIVQQRQQQPENPKPRTAGGPDQRSDELSKLAENLRAENHDNGLPVALGDSATGSGGLLPYTLADGSLDNSGRLPLTLNELKVPKTIRTYISSGNGLIGGTSWILGYNVPPGANRALIDEAKRRLRQMAADKSEKVDLNRYNFVLGIAASTAILKDLASRVYFDELSNGKATQQDQIAYNSLRGRAFNELGCHSNGAMICLAALENGDIKADRVVLYGPQITPESLRMWEKLIQTKPPTVRSVQIYLNQNDPVPPLSLLFGGQVSGPIASAGVAAAATAPPLTAGVVAGLVTEKVVNPVPKPGDRQADLPYFTTDGLTKQIRQLAPSIGVKTFACSSAITTLKCHDMAAYTKDRGP